jgi:hypothetical protein
VSNVHQRQILKLDFGSKGPSPANFELCEVLTRNSASKSVLLFALSSPRVVYLLGQAARAPAPVRLLRP